MSRSWELFLQDMEEATLKILRRTRGLTLEAFKEDEVVYDAVVRNLETLGEAAKGIPSENRDQLPGIDWRRVAGLRDILSHAYFAIDDTTLWDIIQRRFPRWRNSSNDSVSGSSDCRELCPRALPTASPHMR